MAIPLRAARQWDLVLYGATGFTGKLTAEYLAANAPASVKWALGGRSLERLTAFKAELVAAFPRAANVGIVVGEGATATNIATSSRAVITTAGPFALYGEPLIAACAECGTDYCDLTGEPAWVNRMIAKYDAVAQKSGAIIVCMSGFDSIPADLGTFFVVSHVRASHGARVNDVTAIVRMKGGISGGTVASGLNSMRDPDAATSDDPLLMFPSHVAGTPPSAAEVAVVKPNADIVPPFEISAGSSKGRWATFFPMSPINTRVVRRSAGILRARGASLVSCKNALPALKLGNKNAEAVTGKDPSATAGYSVTPFSYAEFMPSDSWIVSRGISAGISIARFALTTIPGMLPLAGRLLTQPGQGPDAKARAAARFTYELIARVEENADGAVVIGQVRGGDAGYGDTSKMIAEAGLALALERGQLPGTLLGGGFLTPSTAFGRALITRLQKCGITFEITHDDLEKTTKRASL